MISGFLIILSIIGQCFNYFFSTKKHVNSCDEEEEVELPKIFETFEIDTITNDPNILIVGNREDFKTNLIKQIVRSVKIKQSFKQGMVMADSIVRSEYEKVCPDDTYFYDLYDSELIDIVKPGSVVILDNVVSRKNAIDNNLLDLIYSNNTAIIIAISEYGQISKNVRRQLDYIFTFSGTPEWNSDVWSFMFSPFIDEENYLKIMDSLERNEVFVLDIVKFEVFTFKINTELN